MASLFKGWGLFYLASPNPGSARLCSCTVLELLEAAPGKSVAAYFLRIFANTQLFHPT